MANRQDAAADQMLQQTKCYSRPGAAAKPCARDSKIIKYANSEKSYICTMTRIFYFCQTVG